MLSENLDNRSEIKQKIGSWIFVKPTTCPCFKQPNTWWYMDSPDGQYWNQIDYVIGSRRWKIYVLFAKTRLEVDCGMGHELLIANIRVKLKKRTKRIIVPKYNVYNILVDLKSNIKKTRFCTIKLNWPRTRNVD